MGIRDWIRRKPKQTFSPVLKVSQGEVARASDRQFETSPPPSVYGNYFHQSTAVYRAVHLRSESVSSARLVVMDTSGEMTEPVGSEHPVQQMLDRMNRWWTAADIIYGTEANLSLWGESFWHIDKETDPQNPTVWLLRPDQMQIIPDRSGDEYILGFKYATSPGHFIAFEPDEIVWFRRYNPMSEFTGASPIAPGRASFDTGIEATLFNRNFYINGATPSEIIFTVNQPVSQEEYEEFIKKLNDRHSGTKNAHKPIVWDLTQGAEPKSLGLNQKDMEFSQSLRWTTEEAARVFGVMPPLMMDTTATTLDNVKQARIEFYQSTVMNEWRFIERELNELLLTILGIDTENLSIRFASEEVPSVQEARNEERGRLLAQTKDGTLTINEFRELEGLDPVEWGDVWWAPANLIPVADSEGFIAPVAEPVEDPDLDEDPDPDEDPDDTLEESMDRFIE